MMRDRYYRAPAYFSSSTMKHEPAHICVGRADKQLRPKIRQSVLSLGHLRCLFCLCAVPGRPKTPSPLSRRAQRPALPLQYQVLVLPSVEAARHKRRGAKNYWVQHPTRQIWRHRRRRRCLAALTAFTSCRIVSHIYWTSWLSWLSRLFSRQSAN